MGDEKCFWMNAQQLFQNLDTFMRDYECSKCTTYEDNAHLSSITGCKSLFLDLCVVFELFSEIWNAVRGVLEVHRYIVTGF